MKIKTLAVYIYIVNGEQGRDLERTGKWVSKNVLCDKGYLPIVSRRCGVGRRKVTLDFWWRWIFDTPLSLDTALVEHYIYIYIYMPLSFMALLFDYFKSTSSPFLQSS